VQIAQGKQLAMPLAARLEYPVWEKVLKSSGLSDEDTQKIIGKVKSAYVKWDENAFPGMLANVVAGRIANRLNLGGINCVVDAACASSFAALKMAVSDLIEHRSDMMLTGGVDTDNSIMAYISFSKTPAVTPGDKVQPFDAKSDGMMLGEGIGMIVLKRLEDAERDGDKIYAVIRGIGTSSDGRFKSIYAPRKEGQVKALERAYDDAGFNPSTVGLVEAHGTGTMAGDPTEFASLREFFGEDNARKQYIALGSVKSQIGHTKAAAGAASLIKTVLALHHKILPPTINVTEPNPKLNIKNSPFYLNTQTRPWIRAEGEPPRRAGVSSFGFGGTNYHIVLEEYNIEPKTPYRIHNSPLEVLLFAPNAALLQARCEEVLGKLQSDLGDKEYLELGEECKNKEIPLNAARIGFVVESRTEACKFLQVAVEMLRTKAVMPAWEHPQGIFYRQSGLELGGKVVALFSGQGSQYLEMGRELLMNFPNMRQLYGYMDSLLLKDNLQPLSEIVFPHPVFEESEKNAQIAALQRTEYAQPAIGMLSAGLYKTLQQAGFKSDFVAGHSFGELTALWAAGVFSDEDYCLLVKARGRAMAAPEDPGYDAGAMLAVKEEISKVEAAIKQFPRVTIANFNSQNQVVLAGPTADINQVRLYLHEQGYAAVLLPVSAAFHTPLIAFAQKSFAIALKSVKFQAPKIPVFSNVTGNLYSKEPHAIQRILETQLASSVLFKQEIESIYSAGGYCFVEFGPRKILTNLVKDILGERPHLAIALNGSHQKNSDRTMREAVVQLRVAGLPLKDLDPYQIAQPPIAQTNKGLNIRINGVNYVSDKTKKVWEDALSSDHQIQLPITQPKVLEETLATSVTTHKELASLSPSMTIANSSNHSGNGHHSNPQITTIPTIATSSVSTHAEQPSLDTKPVISDSNGKYSNPSEMPATSNQKLEPQTISPAKPTVSKIQPASSKLVDYQRVLESLEYVLRQFQQNQSENLQVHGLYLNHQQEYAQTFFQLMQQQNELLKINDNSNDAAEIKPVVMESLERSMMQFHSQQGETLRIHQQYLQHQVEYTKQFFQLIQQEYKQVITGDISVLGIEGVNGVEEVKKVEELKPVAELEEVKPVAIEEFKKVEEVKPVAKLEELKKVEEVKPIAIKELKKDEEVKPVAIEELKKVEEVKPVAIEELKKVEEVKPVVKLEEVKKVEEVKLTTEVTLPTIVATNIDLSGLSDRLLAITSEKTGYPVEMLELDMDMEADLGIDSIKRVEIMGALQDAFPEMPKPSNMEEVAELRTIGQIVNYLQSNSSKGVSVEIAEVQSVQIAEIPVATPIVEAVEVAVTKTATAIQEVALLIPEPEIVANDTTTADFANLDQALLSITSEKTGYPVEMLELDMDMEADLGIDSIKRVEIMGALQEAFPDLPKPSNMEEVAELRTIGQIVDYLQKLAGDEKKKPKFDSIDRPTDVEIVDSRVKRLPAQLQHLCEPDWLDFNLPEGYISLITDDGTQTTSLVAQSLIERGWKVVILNFPATVTPEKCTLPAGVNRVALTDFSEEHLEMQLSAIASTYGSIGAFIHIHPMFQTPGNEGILYNPAEKAIVKHVFFMAKHLKKSLNEAAQQGRSCFCTVARLDGAFGLASEVNFGAIGAGLFGLSKTLVWEWANVYCRAIDISPSISVEQSVHYILAELHDPNRNLTEVAYGSQGRVTLIAI
jgi:acyl transferase domain-containing protein